MDVTQEAIKEIAGLAVGAVKVDAIEIHGIPAIVKYSPDGPTVELRPDLLDKPRMIQESVSFSEMASFGLYFNRFKSDGSVLFGSRDSKRVSATFDYHAPGKPDWCQHTATLQFVPDKDWERWTKASQSKMSQEDFSRFIEEMRHTIVSPPAADLVDIVSSMEVSVGAEFKRSVNRVNGTVQFTYNQDQKIQNVVVPEKITVRVPVFRGGTPCEFDATLHWRVSEGGTLSLSYAMIRPDMTMDAQLVVEFERVKGLCDTDILITQ